jgi:protein-S-isoprenylcysteine O-methyltransferase Ste14
MSILGTIGWLACCVYGSIPSFWLVIHPRADDWRTRHVQGRPVYKILVPLWIGMWIALFAITYLVRHVALYRFRYSWLFALPFFAAGIFLYASARRGFSPLQLSGHHELEPERHQQRLVVTGIRQHVRHPIYLGHLLEMFGWSIGSGLLVCWVLAAFAIVTGVRMIRKEEEELIGRFGESYRQYQRQVSAIIPR